ncbi:hypothetical protein M514_21094 [Trichuris suis]|uniref:Uncharacterized protein n=1 Tax=Trichuris suis TaxID=68888 RepID=A0A085NB99_9BILA|nr:hypothetical protein M514_21094 [Trichuris suis]
MRVATVASKLPITVLYRISSINGRVWSFNGNLGKSSRLAAAKIKCTDEPTNKQEHCGNNQLLHQWTKVRNIAHLLVIMKLQFRDGTFDCCWIERLADIILV